MALPPSNGQTVLITGINGYIASVLGLHLLKKGYTLRGTTRRSASTEPLLKGPYALYKDRFRVYEVPDITVSGAFDEAVKSELHHMAIHILLSDPVRCAWNLPHSLPSQFCTRYI